MRERPCFRCGLSPGKPFYCGACEQERRKDARTLRKSARREVLRLVGLPGTLLDVPTAKGPPVSVVFQGCPGGPQEARLASAVARALGDLAVSRAPDVDGWWGAVRYVAASDLLDHARSGEEAWTLDRYLEVETLAIAGLGTEHRTSWTCHTLARVVEDRARENRVTMASTIFPQETIKQMYGLDGPRLVAAFASLGARWEEIE